MEPKLISFRIGRIRRAFRAEFEKRAAALDITKAQYHVLSRLWRGDGILTSVLARDVNVTGSTLAGVLDRLES
jgi:DNA-binding MarR family transcriptional regulator